MTTPPTSGTGGEAPPIAESAPVRAPRGRCADCDEVADLAVRGLAFGSVCVSCWRKFVQERLRGEAEQDADDEGVVTPSEPSDPPLTREQARLVRDLVVAAVGSGGRVLVETVSEVWEEAERVARACPAYVLAALGGDGQTTTDRIDSVVKAIREVEEFALPFPPRPPLRIREVGGRPVAMEDADGWDVVHVVDSRRTIAQLPGLVAIANEGLKPKDPLAVRSTRLRVVDCARTLVAYAGAAEVSPGYLADLRRAISEHDDALAEAPNPWRHRTRSRVSPRGPGLETAAVAAANAGREAVDFAELEEILRDLVRAGEGAESAPSCPDEEPDLDQLAGETLRSFAGYANRLARAMGREIPYPKLDPSWWGTAAERRAARGEGDPTGVDRAGDAVEPERKVRRYTGVINCEVLDLADVESVFRRIEDAVAFAYSPGLDGAWPGRRLAVLADLRQALGLAEREDLAGPVGGKKGADEPAETAAEAAVDGARGNSAVTDKHFRDWESHVFGYGYGTGERYVIGALRTFLGACRTDGKPGTPPRYDYRELETALTPATAWLLINALIRVDVAEYGVSPRYGWLTASGEALRGYMLARTTDQLLEVLDEDDPARCFPYSCRCSSPCNNPLWGRWSAPAAGNGRGEEALGSSTGARADEPTETPGVAEARWHVVDAATALVDELYAAGSAVDGSGLLSEVGVLAPSIRDLRAACGRYRREVSEMYGESATEVKLLGVGRPVEVLRQAVEAALRDEVKDALKGTGDYYIAVRDVAERIGRRLGIGIERIVP